jgi:hypothetical protein
MAFFERLKAGDSALITLPKSCGQACRTGALRPTLKLNWTAGERQNIFAASQSGSLADAKSNQSERRENMTLPEHMQVVTNYAHYSPRGEVTLSEGVALVTNAIRFCREKEIARLLVDTTSLIGFPPPMIYERYWFSQEWAHEAKSKLVISMVARKEMIDPQKFGVLVARNAGLNVEVSPSLSEALAWLLAQKAPVPN